MHIVRNSVLTINVMIVTNNHCSNGFHSWSHVVLAVQKPCPRAWIMGIGWQKCHIHVRLKQSSVGKFVFHESNLLEHGEFLPLTLNIVLQ